MVGLGKKGLLNFSIKNTTHAESAGEEEELSWASEESGI